MNLSLNLSQEEISTVLYCMEDYIKRYPDRMNDPTFENNVENIFEELEGAVDDYHNSKDGFYVGSYGGSM